MPHKHNSSSRAGGNGRVLICTIGASYSRHSRLDVALARPAPKSRSGSRDVDHADRDQSRLLRGQRGAKAFFELGRRSLDAVLTPASDKGSGFVAEPEHDVDAVSGRAGVAGVFRNQLVLGSRATSFRLLLFFISTGTLKAIRQ